MPQLNLYIDDDLLKKIESAAKMADTSISRWVRNRLIGAMGETWPEGYFGVFGSLAETDLARPPQGELSDDAPREIL